MISFRPLGRCKLSTAQWILRNEELLFSLFLGANNTILTAKEKHNFCWIHLHEKKKHGQIVLELLLWKCISTRTIRSRCLAFLLHTKPIIWQRENPSYEKSNPPLRCHTLKLSSQPYQILIFNGYISLVRRWLERIFLLLCL